MGAGAIYGRGVSISCSITRITAAPPDLPTGHDVGDGNPDDVYTGMYEQLYAVLGHQGPPIYSAVPLPCRRLLHESGHQQPSLLESTAIAEPERLQPRGS